MQRKLIFFITIFLFLVGVSTAICQNNSINNDQTSKNQKDIEKQIDNIERQLESIHTSYERNYRELHETKNELSNKFTSDISSITNQFDLVQENIENLSQEIDATRNNFSNILATAMSSDWTQIGMFWSSMILVFITVMSTYINYRIFRLQTDPDVIVYATPDPNRPSIINLIIENIGKGIAKDIKFSSDKPIPCRAFGIGDNASVPPTMSTGPLIVGIPELGPSSKRIITWGQYHGLLKGLGDEILAISADYSARKVFVKTPKFKPTFFLDIKSFGGTDASDQNWDKKSAENIEKIAGSIKEIASVIKNKS